jgi:hypothetical protein
MNSIRTTKFLLAGLLTLTFLLAFNLQITIVYQNDSNLNLENPLTQTQNDFQHFEDNLLNNVDSRYKFNTSGVDFSDNNPFYIDYLAINQETITNSSAIAEDEYRFWNVSLAEGYYITIKAFFVVDPPKNQGDFDMDVFSR